MAIVVDASVALKWFLSEIGSFEAEALQAAGGIIAPDLVVTEVLNGLWKAWRKSLVPRDQLDRSVPIVAPSFSRLASSAGLAEQAWPICILLDHPIYDCLYLALAEREDCEMVTADARLLTKVRGTAFAKRVRPLI